MYQRPRSRNLTYLALGGVLLLALIFSSVPSASAGRPLPSPAVEITEALTNTPAPTVTATTSPIYFSNPTLPSCVGAGCSLPSGYNNVVGATLNEQSLHAYDPSSKYWTGGGRVETKIRVNGAGVGTVRVYYAYNGVNCSAGYAVYVFKLSGNVNYPNLPLSGYFDVTVTSSDQGTFSYYTRCGSSGSYVGDYGIDSLWYSLVEPATPTPTATATLTSTPTNTPTNTPSLTPTATPSNCIDGDYEIQGVTGNNGSLDFYGVGGDSHVWNPSVMYYGDYINSVWIIKDVNNIVELGWYKRGEGWGVGSDLKFFRVWKVSGIYHEDAWGSPSENSDHTFMLYTLNVDEAWRFVVDGEQRTPTIIAPELYYGDAGAMRERHNSCDSGWAHWWNLQKCNDYGCTWTPWQSINERNINDPNWFLDFVSISNFFVNLR